MPQHKNTFEERMYQSLKRKGLAPQFERAGIYCILLDGKPVYIGKSVNMLSRMAQHYTQLANPQEHKYRVLAEASRHGHTVRFSVLYAAKETEKTALENEIGEKEGQYIRQYNTPLNYQIPKEENWKSYTVNPRARTITLKELLERDNSI